MIMFTVTGTCPVKGQIFKQCGMDPSCATTCADRSGFSFFCPEVCSFDGVCACPAGTIIDEDSNECVPQNVTGFWKTVPNHT